MFEKFNFGPFEPRNRVFMASLTRMRANKDGTPNELLLEYYS